jgi:hypothetical protein
LRFTAFPHLADTPGGNAQRQADGNTQSEVIQEETERSAEPRADGYG